MNEYLDTYFFSGAQAHKIASEQNRYENDYMLQACYYDGEKIDSDLVNLIHLPVDNMLEDLAKGIYRIPDKVSLDGLELSESIKMEIEANFNMSLIQVREYRKEYNKHYIKNLKYASLNFDEPLRFYLIANSETQVMQYVSKSIAGVLKNAGYEVYYDLYYGIEDVGSTQNISKFNPHVVINLNHMNNAHINNDCFNFVWFQDPMPILMDAREIMVRDRDYIFSYQTIYTNLLLKKHVPSTKIFKQEVLPVNPEEFFYDKSIKREDKIIFVGSFYDSHNKEDFLDKKIAKQIKEFMSAGNVLSYENLDAIFEKNSVEITQSSRDVYFNEIQQSYARNLCVEWMCNSDKKVDLYGYKWELAKNNHIMQHFRGIATKSELNLLYNSAKYVLAASGQLINTQRLGEIVHAGAIPVIYDSRDITDEVNTWDDECLYFKTQEELHAILDNNLEPKKYRTKEMLDFFTYTNFLNTMFEQINKKLNRET